MRAFEPASDPGGACDNGSSSLQIAELFAHIDTPSFLL